MENVSWQGFVVSKNHPKFDPSPFGHGEIT